MIGDVLWEPTSARWADTNLRRFGGWLATERGVEADGYAALHRWSVEHLEDYWGAWWEYAEVDATPYSSVLSSRDMPGARWFEGAELNYAQHALRRGDGRDDEVAVVGRSQTRGPVDLMWG